jgi:hypothetical protein
MFSRSSQNAGLESVQEDIDVRAALEDSSAKRYDSLSKRGSDKISVRKLRLSSSDQARHVPFASQNSRIPDDRQLASGDETVQNSNISRASSVAKLHLRLFSICRKRGTQREEIVVIGRTVLLVITHVPL